jgi:iron complex outermembrane receptor protein
MDHENTGRRQTRSVRSRASWARVLLPALAIVLLSFGPTAFQTGSARAEDESPAATPTDDRSGGLQEIVVTARKREEPLQIAPVSISATSGAILEQAQVTRIDDIGQFAPSLEVSQQAGFPGTALISIRGIGFPDPILTSDSPVAMYVDGVYLGRTAGALLDLVDIDRVEVLRGPQGTLFGRNTPGGALNIYTQGPGQKFGVEQKLGYASNNEITSTTTLDTGELWNSGLSAKVTYRHHQMDGYQRNTLTSWANSQGADNTDDVFAAVRFHPVDDFTADYKFDDHDEASIPVGFQVSEVEPYVATYFGNSPNVGGAPFTTPSLSRGGSYSDFSFQQAKVRIAGHSLTLNYHLSDALNIKSITAYRSLFENDSSDLGNSGQLKGLTSPCPPFFQIPGCSIPETVQNVYVYYTPYDHQHQHQLSQELQFGGAYQDLNYVLGLYYFDEHVGETQPSTITVPLPGAGFPDIAPFNIMGFTNNSLLAYSGTSSSKAGYSQVSYAPTELFDKKLELTGGIRYTKDEKSLDQNDTIAVRNLSHSFSNFSKSASVKYQWTTDVMSYVRYSEGYKAGGYSARAQVNGSGPQGAYAPEKAKSYEVGMKTEFLDNHVRFNADLFKTNYDDLQISQLVELGGVLATQVYNAGTAVFYGGEAELTVLPYPGWQVNATLGYVDPEYKKFLFGTPPNQIDVSSIAHVGVAAKVSTSASVQYSFAPMPVGDLTLRTDYSYLGPRYYVIGDFTTNASGQGARQVFPGLTYVSDATRAPGFSNVGAQIILDNVPVGLGGQWMVTVYGKNLLNQFQKVQGLDLTGLGVIDNAWGRGRVVGVNLAAKF